MKPERKERLFDALRGQLLTLGSHARESLLLRWELARLEIGCDLQTLKRFAIALAVSLVGILVALPLLVSSLAHVLDGAAGIAAEGWLAILGGALLVFCILLAWIAWRRCRSRFVGLEETLEELHEDAVWLREWLGKTQPEEALEEEPNLAGEPSKSSVSAETPTSSE